MRQKKAIPIAFNMSLGLIPIIACMVLLDFINARYALSLSAILGIIYSVGSYQTSKKKIYNFIAYVATGVLIVLTAVVFIFPSVIPQNFMPFTLETFMLVFTGFLFYGQRHLKKMCVKVKNPQRLDLLIKSMDSSIVSARLIFIVGVLHFILIFIVLIFAHYPLSNTVFYLLFHCLPILFLLIVIGINQLAIGIANRLTHNEAEIPIVNEFGDVIGKRYKMEAAVYKDEFINPVIRIAFINNGMLFLCNRRPENIIDINKVDLPLETFLEFGEDLNQGVERIMSEAYPEKVDLQPRFSLKYSFKTPDTNRLVYLYITYVENEELLNNPYFIHGKLWTSQQIEMNLEKNFFGQQFEKEYDYLKETVKIWEEFK